METKQASTIFNCAFVTPPDGDLDCSIWWVSKQMIYFIWMRWNVVLILPPPSLKNASIALVAWNIRISDWYIVKGRGTTWKLCVGRFFWNAELFSRKMEMRRDIADSKRQENERRCCSRTLEVNLNWNINRTPSYQIDYKHNNREGRSYRAVEYYDTDSNSAL